MTLILCLECKKEVSNQALACPNCGAPISNKSPQITIKRKGSKWEGIGTIIVITGFISMLSGAPIGLLILLLGLIIFIIGRFK